MAPRHIGIDGFNIALPQGTGVATYGVALAETLLSAGNRVTGVFGLDAGIDPAMREILFFDRLWRGPPSATPAARRRRRRELWPAYWPFMTVQAQEVPLTARVDRAQLADRFPSFSRLVSRGRLFDLAHRYFMMHGRFLKLHVAEPPAIMHWTYPLPITLLGARNVYTIHDLVPLKLPYTTLDAKAAYRRLVARCILEAAQICTVSEASRQDILTEFDADPARVTNCYQTAVIRSAPLGTPEADATVVRGAFGLEPDGYFIFVGAIEPKKNVGRLIEAFLSLDIASPLVIVGGRGWQSEEELRLLPSEDGGGSERTRRIAERIVRLDHLPRGLLTSLVRSARAVLFPSIAEGFGLPVLEAMLLGVPVLTSCTSSLREIGGEAALLVDPYDVRAIASGILALDLDAALRQRLRAAGPASAERFSPARYRERLDLLYKAAEDCPPV